MISVVNGHKRLDLQICGRKSVFMLPRQARQGNPWLWRTEFFDAFDNADMALMERGFFRAYHQIPDLYGAPAAIQYMNEFYHVMVNDYKMNKKAVMVGLSRGGLYALNFAAQYPEKVSMLYLDAPVVDICSWPGGRGASALCPKEWEECKKVYCLTEDTASGFINDSIFRIHELVSKGIPIILVAGDSDLIVPYQENGLLLQKIYQENNGRLKVILKHGMGHHPHGLADPAPIVDFIEQYGNII